MHGSLILKRASASRPSGEWNDDDYDVLANGEVVGRIFKVAASPVGAPWMWTLIFGFHEGRTDARPRADEHFFLALVPHVKSDTDRCGCYPSLALPAGGIR
jgi:hypothetical protein